MIAEPLDAAVDNLLFEKALAVIGALNGVYGNDSGIDNGSDGGSNHELSPWGRKGEGTVWVCVLLVGDRRRETDTLR
jgi:hypothetical protein